MAARKEGPPMPNAPKPAARKRSILGSPGNDKADHEGSPHDPSEFKGTPADPVEARVAPDDAEKARKTSNPQRKTARP
jgi:hypothetical protein